MSRRIVLGTAGNIDHGKTSLIKALTGIETDRLKEEKRRGITIELGFAHLALTDGQTVGVVDVPGHERFVRTMVAGATGVDLVLLVIAADEGVMPQTKEHVDVCTVLGVTKGVVVLTKIDMVEEDWLELVKEDVNAYLAETFLREAPLVQVSAQTGEGVEELRELLTETCRSIEERREGGPFRMPVDRAFTMKGFGTVVTGTSLSGRMAVGGTAEIFPRGLKAKVRGLQVHGSSEEEISSGQRTAVNLSGLELQEVVRGDVLASPGALLPATRFDAALNLLPSAAKGLKNRASVHFHVGTSDHLARVVPLSKETIEPGEGDYVQLILEEKASCLPGDRFAIRSYSPPLTIGGGRILAVAPPRRKKFDQEAVRALEILDRSPLPDRIALLTAESRLLGISKEELISRLGLTDKELDKPLGELLSKRRIIRYDKERQRYVHHAPLAELSKKIEGFAASFHRANPLKPGLPKEEIKTRLKLHADPRIISFQVSRMVEEGVLKAEEDLIALAGHEVSLGGDESDLKDKILADYRQGALSPPTTKALAEKLGRAKIKDVLALLVKEGSLIKVKEELFFDRDAIEELEGRLRAHFAENKEMSTQDFKEMTGLSRKFLIPLAEYYDRTGVTIRVGEVRRLREKLG